MSRTIAKQARIIGLYLLVFLMLCEWMIPVVNLTSTGHLGLFLLFIVLCLAGNAFNINIVLSFVVKIIYIAWFLMYVYMGTAVFSLNSFTRIISEFTGSIGAVTNGDWNGIADSFRSILFFVLLWMAIYLIHHWITAKRSIFYFFLVTIIFLSLLDTFTEYDAKHAIIRTMIEGTLLMSGLYLYRLLESERALPEKRSSFKWLLPFVCMIAVCTLFAYVAPKKQAVVAPPQPLKKLLDMQQNQTGEIGKIGYVEDDEKLGGPFEEDHRPVFVATAKENQYWRIETKNIYTGKGWVRKKGDIYVHTFDYGEKIPMSLKPGKQKNREHAEIELKKDYKFVLQPYGLQKMDEQSMGDQFYIEIDSEKIRPTIDGKKIVLPSYSMTYSKPEYSLKALSRTRTSDLKGLSKDFKPYLQVPKTLPARVEKLAKTITKDEKSLYGKANAIVSYFQNNGYKYSRLEVGTPEGKQDYVDQFLFDTKSGYCDNFSTSMAVMLRTIGIPSRWVKGFSEGDEVPMSDNKHHYVVTNNNAHSWVEAYFPGVGWMSFEPTIGFGGFDNVLNDVKSKEKKSAINPKQKENEQQKVEKKKKEEKKKEKKVKKEKKKEKKQVEKKSATNQTNNWSAIWLGILIGAVAILLLLFFTRRKWMPKWLIFKHRTQGYRQLDTMYEDLLKQLKRAGHRRKEGQTLKDFAEHVDAAYSTDKMGILTRAMEERLYNKDVPGKPSDELIECWKYLINRTSG
ncbi:transglutaminase-like domain-containing protein [Rummeliibacillus stabekisii]|uniref:transglutaminase-like domain-containing protein n=1 Tax=Rummeliibacillus stabekisii TaxID=241244 RepID=UPI00203E8E38|nr:transglutaminase-like domain-containing protein [Rummeliibacillus stabekisii]MCM3318135.1 transglutaminase-like domain-containing protein [Rummeliibacillus stabekisii]